MLPDIKNKYELQPSDEKNSYNSRENSNIKESARQAKCASYKKIYKFKSSLFSNKSRILTQKLFSKSIDIDRPKKDDDLFEQSPEIPKCKKNIVYRISKKKVNFADIMNENEKKVNSQSKNEIINSSNINSSNTNITNTNNKNHLNTKVSNNDSKYNEELTKKIIFENINEINKKNNIKTLIKIKEIINSSDKNNNVIQNYNNKNLKKPIEAKKNTRYGNILVLYPALNDNKKLKVSYELKKDDHGEKEKQNLEVKKLHSIDKFIYDKNRLHNENTMKKNYFLGNKNINSIIQNYGGYLRYKKNK